MAKRSFRNLLITGGCGFIGTNFIRYLFQQPDFRGCIINVDKLTYAGNPESLKDLAEQYPDRYFFHRADICDLKGLDALTARYDIDGICHFAAESHVDRSIKKPADFIYTNIIGTFNLLEIARSRGEAFTLFHHVSTDEVYGSLGTEGSFTETTPYHPNSPYSAAKAASDHLVRAYFETYRLPATLSNCSNNYGPYQFPEKLIPLMILNALAFKTLPVYGDGKNVRDWLHVEDHCQAVWTIMSYGTIGETYNVGGNAEMENISVVQMICDILDEMVPPSDGRSRRTLIAFVKDRPGHDRRYAIDAGKLRRELDWSPRESFGTGLKKTIRWYLENMSWTERIKSGEYLDWIKQHYGH